VDSPERFASILEGLEKVSADFRLPVIYPVHPRARKMMDEFKLQPRNIRMVESVDFLSFLQLENNSRLVLTDSGGVQEESCILGVPCVTLRDNTERPETIEVGANVLAGASADGISRCTRLMLNKERNWENPFGDGHAGERIASLVTAQSVLSL
jgi:UDP-N-acetylglucosamine 2-epimerase (non-hydrolysing)